MILNDIDRRRIARDIARHVETQHEQRNLNQAMQLLREFGLGNATIAMALGLDHTVVSKWATGNRPCPPERQAELDAMLRQVCNVMLKAEDIPPEAWVVCGRAYYKALSYLGESSVVTPDEKAMLSNAGGMMMGVMNA